MQKIIELKEHQSAIIERRKKQKKRNIITLFIILGIVLLILVYVQSPLSHISKVTIKGNHFETNQYYIEKSGLTVGDSLWGFKKDQVVQNLEKLDFVKQVTVERKWLNSVAIKIKENRRVAILRTSNAQYYVLENGELLPGRIKPKSYELPIFLNLHDEKQRKELAKQLMQLSPDLLQMISQIEPAPTKSNPELLKMYMNDGFEVRIDIPKIASKMKYYPSIIAQLNQNKKGVIHLEIGGYYNSFKLEYK
ncbi:cell division protein FtsQ/DivIB [Kurthia gibsonii]|uniref:cell division protein FtsQ/DivIB n=1 Tax=Kurthia gibsonii TaxID=33946 RepID=UPI0011441572|nr:FtsQ-type POTRA domain-containing protein [Kurthia gibsonii]GED18580.1 cell division protein DivIB [Kurthia gibsonii]